MGGTSENGKVFPNDIILPPCKDKLGKYLRKKKQFLGLFSALPIKNVKFFVNLSWSNMSKYEKVSKFSIGKKLMSGFSACGGIRTARSMQVLTVYFPLS